MKKAQETPAVTKPMKQLGAERQYSSKDRSVRQHPFVEGGPGKGERNVGKGCKEDARTCKPADKSVRKHPFQGK